MSSSVLEFLASRLSWQEASVRFELAWLQGLKSFCSFLWLLLRWSVWLTLVALANWSIVLPLGAVLYIRYHGFLSFLPFFSTSAAPTVVEVIPVWVPWLAVYSVLITLAFVFLVLKPKRVVRICEHGFQVERAVQGSEPVKTPPPDFVGVVFVMRGGVKTRNGTFFRVGNYLYTAEHVVMGAERVWFVYNGVEMEVLTPYTVLDVDLIRYSYAPFAQFAMGAGRFPKTAQYSYCQTHNGDLTTFGKLTPSGIGFVEYSGTTLPGFSGCPYYANKTVFGMHVGSGVVNMGFEGAYISALEKTYKPESGDNGTTDPEELIREMRELGDKLQYKRTGNDYVIVQLGGKLRTMDEDEFENLRSRARRYVPESAQLAEFTYQDVEAPTSGNEQQPTVVVSQSAGPSLTPVHESAQLQSLVTLVETLSRRLQAIEKKSSAGPKSTAVRQNAVSLSMFAGTDPCVKAWIAAGLPVSPDGPLKGYPSVSAPKWKTFCDALMSGPSS